MNINKTKELNAIFIHYRTLFKHKRISRLEAIYSLINSRDKVSPYWLLRS